MKTVRSTPLTGAMIASVALLAGCTGSEPISTASATVTSSPTATVSPSVTPTVTATIAPDDEPPSDEAPFPADRAADTADASADARLSPVNIRFGVHDGYDRIVLDLEGTGQPGWLSEYDSDPRTSGSGEPVDLSGDAFLVTHVTGVVYPTEEGAEEYHGMERFRPEGAGVVREVMYGGVYEGQAEIYVGLTSEQPFRVFLLTDPVRVVIDVQHP